MRQISPAAQQAVDDIARRHGFGTEATLVMLDGLGHSPQVEDPARFERALLAAIGPRPR